MDGSEKAVVETVHQSYVNLCLTIESQTYHPFLSAAGGLFLSASGTLLVIYTSVLYFMISGKLWKKPLFLQLIWLGFYEIPLLIIYCFYFYCAYKIDPSLYPADHRSVVGLSDHFLQLTSNLVLTEIALSRAVTIYFPALSAAFFSPKVVSLLLILAPLYGVVGVCTVGISLGLFQPLHMIWCPQELDKGLGAATPFTILAFKLSPIGLAGLFYLLAAATLVMKKLKFQFSPQGSPAASNTVPSAEENAQYDMLKLAVIIFSLYLPEIVILGPTATDSHNFFLLSGNVFVRIIVVGMNPILYLVFSPTVRGTVHLPMCLCCAQEELIAQQHMEEPQPEQGIIAVHHV